MILPRWKNTTIVTGRNPREDVRVEEQGMADF
jgi:hypothetical protein